MGIWDDIKNSFRSGSSLIRLIYINVAVFIFLAIISIIGFLIKNQELPEKILGFLAVPASLKALIIKPWTLVTYMFTHKEVLHILFNMLWLYWFGIIFLEYLDQSIAPF